MLAMMIVIFAFAFVCCAVMAIGLVGGGARWERRERAARAAHDAAERDS